MSDQAQDWLDELPEREVNDLARRVIDEDRISTDTLRRMIRETGVAAEEAPGYEPTPTGS